jgi:hypothetical protein
MARLRAAWFSAEPEAGDVGLASRWNLPRSARGTSLAALGSMAKRLLQTTLAFIPFLVVAGCALSTTDADPQEPRASGRSEASSSPEQCYAKCTDNNGTPEYCETSCRCGNCECNSDAACRRVFEYEIKLGAL